MFQFSRKTLLAFPLFSLTLPLYIIDPLDHNLAITFTFPSTQHDGVKDIFAFKVLKFGIRSLLKLKYSPTIN